MQQLLSMESTVGKKINAVSVGYATTVWDYNEKNLSDIAYY